MSKTIEQMSADEIEVILKQKREKEKEASHINNISPIGTWDVETEADDEGRSMVKLGTFTGHVSDIAYSLADKCFYSLHFRPSNAAKAASVPTGRKNVHITMDISSGTWPMNMSHGDRLTAVANFLFREKSKTGFDVFEGQYYASTLLKIGD